MTITNNYNYCRHSEKSRYADTNSNRYEYKSTEVAESRMIGQLDGEKNRLEDNGVLNVNFIANVGLLLSVSEKILNISQCLMVMTKLSAYFLDYPVESVRIRHAVTIVQWPLTTPHAPWHTALSLIE